MADLSTIRIPVDSSPVNDAVAKIRSLELKFRNLVRQTEVGSAQYKRGLLEIKRAYQQLGVSSQKASAEIERYSRAVLNSTEEQKKAKREKELAAKAQRDLNSLLKTASNIMREEEQLLRRRTQEQKAANAELDRQEAAYEQVKQAIDPLYAAQQRYNQQLEIINRKHGQASSSAEALAADIAALQLSFARAGTPVNEMGQITQVMGTRANTLGMVLQQTGYQVGDFAVQVQSGTNAFVAFGQQATQLAGLLYLVPGAIGVLAGTVASIGIPVITGLMGYFSRTGEAAKDVSTSLEDLSSSVDDYASAVEAAIATTEELMDVYGRLPGMAGRASEALDRIVDAQRIAALQNLTLAVDSLVTQFGGFSTEQLGDAMGSELEDTLYNIRSQLDLSRESAYQVALALEAVDKASGLGQLSQALLDANEALIEAGVSANSELAVGLLNAAKEALRLNGLAEKASESVEATGIAAIEAALGIVSLANNLGTAQGAANNLLISMQGVAVAAYEAAMAMATANAQRQEQRIISGYGLYQFTRERAPEFATTPEFTGPRPPNRPFELGVPDLPTGSGATSGGGRVEEQEDLLQQLSERIAKEQELLTLTDAQKQVVQALGDQYGNYSAEQISQVEAQIEAFNRLVEAQKQQQEILNTVDSAMTDAFMSMVTGAKTAEEAFADMARSIIAKLYEMLVVQQIVNAAMGFLQGPTAALTGAPVAMKPLEPKASGGSVMPGTPYLVGEQGPELIIPRHSGTVVNAANTNSAMKSGETVVVNNNISVTGSDAAMVRAEVTKMIPQITEASKAAVINARQRGGQMRATFGG